MKFAEDYPVGSTYYLGSHHVTAEEITEFARTYDPQPYHLSDELGRLSSFGGLIASGWNTAAIWMRLYVTALLPDSAVEGSPGVDELRFLQPVRPGDKLSGTAEIIGTVPSLSDREILIVRNRGLLTNSDGAEVLSLVLSVRFRRRPTSILRNFMDTVSYTAQWTAAARALETERAGNVLFRDPLARRLAEPAGFELLDKYKGAGLVEFVAIRTRYFDDTIGTLLATTPIRQVVLIAAGMDTRAYRLEWPDDVTVYEVDHDDLLSEKERRLADLDAKPTVNLRRVGADLSSDWVPRLREANFDPGQATLWIAEALLFFLEEEQVSRLLQTLRSASAPGSWLAADMLGLTLLRSPATQLFLSALKADGIPWLFGTDQPEAFLAENGWDLRELKEPGEPGVGQGRWPYKVQPRQAKGVSRNWLIRAEVVPPTP